MKKYPKYKPSGVEWIGEIPEEWGLKKIKHLCYVKGRVGWKGLKASEFLIKGYSYLVTGTDFKEGSIDWENCYQIDEERYLEDPYIQLRNDDLLITKDGTIGKLAIVEGLDKPACLNSGIFVVRSLKDNFSTRFLFWILSSEVFRSYNNYTSFGSTIQHLYQNVFVEFNFCVPQKQEQTTIANYLDDKTSTIDLLIEKKKKLIELLKEESKAIINQAVTRGIDPNVKLKPSGIEWLGDIPEHWEVKKLKYLIDSVKGGGTPSTDKKDYWNGNIPWVSPKDMKVSYIENTEDYLTNLALENSATTLIPEKKLLVVVRSGILKHSLPLAINNIPVTLNQDMKAISPNDILDIEYLRWKLTGVANLLLVQCKKIGATVDSIEMEKLMSFSISFTKHKVEQLQIVQHIETETKRIDGTISKIEQEIELLWEYRTALISEVVTGKIKV